MFGNQKKKQKQKQNKTKKRVSIASHHTKEERKKVSIAIIYNLAKMTSRQTSNPISPSNC